MHTGFTLFRWSYDSSPDTNRFEQSFINVKASCFVLITIKNKTSALYLPSVSLCDSILLYLNLVTVQLQKAVCTGTMNYMERSEDRKYQVFRFVFRVLNHYLFFVFLLVIALFASLKLTPFDHSFSICKCFILSENYKIDL